MADENGGDRVSAEGIPVARRVEPVPVARLVRSEDAREKDFPCASCGASVRYDPEAQGLKCEYCGAVRPVGLQADRVEELDYHRHLAWAAEQEDQLEQIVYKCGSCGAETTVLPEVASIVCPYCDTALVHEGGSTQHIKPKSLLPFKVPEADARGAFKKWVLSLWFAPNALKKYADRAEKLSGVYVPYWTYDSNTISWYTGQRGEHYWTTQTYTTRVNGKTVTRTRSVRRTRWYSASGVVANSFDDILILASNSLPRAYAKKLEPWDLDNLVPYGDAFLSGFRTESYQVDLDAGFERAARVMESPIRSTICRDIGGDAQRISSVDTKYEDISFKHILLPIWISAYRFKQKVYRFLVNARTGEVQGERPWSWLKIALLVLGVIGGVAAATGIIALLAGAQ
jgi:DNA-directed RNA polymerase subunit RPC12/RpoP